VSFVVLNILVKLESFFVIITITFRLPFFLSFFSSDTSTGQTNCAMYTNNTPNDEFWAKDVPFGGLLAP